MKVEDERRFKLIQRLMCLLGRASLAQELHYSMVDISCEVGLNTICVQNNIFVFGFKALVEHIT